MHFKIYYHIHHHHQKLLWIFTRRSKNSWQILSEIIFTVFLAVSSTLHFWIGLHFKTAAQNTLLPHHISAATCERFQKGKSKNSVSSYVFVCKWFLVSTSAKNHSLLKSDCLKDFSDIFPLQNIKCSMWYVCLRKTVHLWFSEWLVYQRVHIVGRFCR